MKSSERKKIIVGATGASGMPLLVKCLKLIDMQDEYESWLILSDSARLTLEHENGMDINRLRELAAHVLSPNDIGAQPASGSFQTDGMLIVPCSMKTAAGIAVGYTDNLILRAADVTIKEHRPLVLAARETPLSQIHLRNLYELSKIQNVYIIPPMMTFYNKPKNIEDMVCHIAAKLVEPFGIQTDEYCRWNGLQTSSYQKQR